MVTRSAVCDFPPGFQGMEEIPVLCAIPGVPALARALHGANKEKESKKWHSCGVCVFVTSQGLKPWWLCGTEGQEVALPQGSPWQLSALQMHHHCLHGAPQPFPAAFGTLGAVEDFVEFTCVEYFCSYFFR